jgi:hypothetical protein
MIGVTMISVGSPLISQAQITAAHTRAAISPVVAANVVAAKSKAPLDW